jgi:hypothetical protein
LYVNLVAKGAPKFFKTLAFMIEDFLHLPPVSLTPAANLELRQQIFEKIRNGPNGILRGLGETDS